MRLFYLLVFLSVSVLPVFGNSVVSLFDGNDSLTGWSGDDSCFVVSDGKLRLQAPPDGKVSCLSFPSSSVDDAQWQLSVRMDFNPSGSNCARFYLCSDSPSLRDSLNGYFLQMGNASDQILLYRQSCTSVKKIAAGAEGRLNRDSLCFSVRVSRSRLGEWHVFSKMQDEPDFQEECSAVDSVWKSSFFCGLYCRYTSTRRDAFWFDSLLVEGAAFVDAQPPLLKNVVRTDSLVKFYFSEKIDGKYLSCEVDGLPLSVSWNGVFSELTLHFLSSMEKGKRYAFRLLGVKDVAGNAMPDTVLYMGVPERCMPSDLIINEVLFYPSEGGADYVELYNRSGKVLDVSTLRLATYRSDGASYSAKKIGEMQLFPSEYMLLTSDVENVCSSYSCTEDAVSVKMDKLPNYGNEKGCVVLMDKDSSLIDDFCYTSSMHNELLKDKRGVSLERVSPDGNDWMSASETAGYGTPGYANSVRLTEVDEVRLETDVCYPYQDDSGMLRIYYSFSTGGYVANISIYNVNGICVRSLANNLYLSSQGSLRWDGRDNNGAVVPVAPYVILLEANNSQGDVVRRSFVCVVSW